MTNEVSYIHESWKINAKGKPEQIDPLKISKVLKSKDLGWVHLDANDDRSRAWIEGELEYLDKTIIDALLAKDTRPRIEQIGEGMLLILRGANTNPDEEPEDMVSLRIWIDQHRIITLQRRPLKSIKDISELLQKGQGPKNASEFLAMVCAQLTFYIDNAIQLLSTQLDDVEDAILDKAQASYRSEIVDVRKQSILFKKFINPQRDVMFQIINSRHEWIEENEMRELRENYDQLTRYVETLDANRERAQIVQDELTAYLSEKLNKNLYVLSIITAIFLPLGFLTGLFGINIGGMPGVDNGDAFWIFVAALVAVTAIQIIFFRLMRWL